MAKQAAVVGKKALAADVRVEFGVMTVIGNLYNPLKPAVKSGLHMACPQCAVKGAVGPLKQQYACTIHEDHGSFSAAECERYADTGDGEVLIESSTAKEATTSALPAKLIVLSSYPADEVLPFLVPKDKGDIFQPKGDSTFYNMLLNLIDENGIVHTESGPMVLLSEARVVRDQEKVYHLTKRNGELVFQHVYNPEDVDKIVPVETGDVDANLLTLAAQLIETGAETFNPEDYRAKGRERLNALIEEAKGNPNPIAKTAPKAAPQDIASLLEAAIAANVSKKGK